MRAEVFANSAPRESLLLRLLGGEFGNCGGSDSLNSKGLMLPRAIARWEVLSNMRVGGLGFAGVPAITASVPW